MPPGASTGLDLEGPQWSFALNLYRRPAVSAACLLLQDRVGGDVCLLLFALFVARERRCALEHGDLANLDGAIADWRRDVIIPLRSLRRCLKAGPPPAPCPQTEAMRQRIQTAEIDAEQIELALLARCFDRRPTVASAATADIAAVLDRLARFFALRCGNPAAGTSPEVRTALKTIADALAEP